MSTGTGTGTGSPGPAGRSLAEQLEGLKQRSGRSYEALAHRTGLGRSTIHRYCQGSTLPGTFGAVESVARACGAHETELDRLYRAWSRAIAEQDPACGQERDTQGEEGGPPGNEDRGSDGTGKGNGADATANDGDGDGTGNTGTGTGKDQLVQLLVPLRPLRTYFWLRTAALLVAFLVTSAVISTPYIDGDWGQASTSSKGHGRPPAEQRIRGPLWSVAPRNVSPKFFGLTMNTDTGSMPDFRTGSVRLWNSETRWGSIEKRRRHYDWRTLDRMVESAEREDLPVLFTFGGTPPWAARDGAKSPFADSLASPPDDLGDWDRFVEKVAERYKGRIESYELWDYPSDKRMWAGSLSALAELVERAARIIQRTDRDAKIACPSFGSLWSDQGRERLRKFVRTGAYDNCDAAALKMPPRRADGRPEEIIGLARTVYGIFHKYGPANIQLWNTGPDIDVTGAPKLDARRARDYAVRFYLAGLFSRPYGMKRMYFYNWGGSQGIPLVVQPVGGPPTEAGLRMDRLMTWLDDARIAACGQGSRMGLAKGAYTCSFERDGKRLRVCWTARGRARLPLEKGAFRLRHMDGRTEGIEGGDSIAFGEEPVLVEHG